MELAWIDQEIIHKSKACLFAVNRDHFYSCHCFRLFIPSEKILSAAKQRADHKKRLCSIGKY